MQSSLDIDLQRVERFKLLTSVQNFFNTFNRVKKTVAVPFIIGATNVFTDCKFYAYDKLQVSKEVTHYCYHEEHILMYSKFGSKIINCKHCTNYKNNKRSK